MQEAASAVSVDLTYGHEEYLWLDKGRNLLVSRSFEWMAEKTQIVQCINQILHDSIQASPHMTPVKTGNRRVNGFETHPNDHHQVGGDLSLPFEIVTGDDLRHYTVVRKTDVATVYIALEPSLDELEGE
jgi:hypothetical protein